MYEIQGRNKNREEQNQIFFSVRNSGKKQDQGWTESELFSVWSSGKKPNRNREEQEQESSDFAYCTKLMDETKQEITKSDLS